MSEQSKQTQNQQSEGSQETLRARLLREFREWDDNDACGYDTLIEWAHRAAAALSCPSPPPNYLRPPQVEPYVCWNCQKRADEQPCEHCGHQNGPPREKVEAEGSDPALRARLWKLLHDADSALQAHHAAHLCAWDDGECPACKMFGGVELFRRLRDMRLEVNRWAEGRGPIPAQEPQHSQN